MYAYRIKKYIGSYAAVLNGLNAIVFTAGVGENDNIIPSLISNQMDNLGIELDEEKNKERVDSLRAINTEVSKVKILIVPTNEELEMAKQCYGLIIEEVFA